MKNCLLETGKGEVFFEQEGGTEVLIISIMAEDMACVVVSKERVQELRQFIRLIACPEEVVTSAQSLKLTAPEEACVQFAQLDDHSLCIQVTSHAHYTTEELVTITAEQVQELYEFLKILDPIEKEAA